LRLPMMVASRLLRYSTSLDSAMTYLGAAAAAGRVRQRVGRCVACYS